MALVRPVILFIEDILWLNGTYNTSSVRFILSSNTKSQNLRGGVGLLTLDLYTGICRWRFSNGTRDYTTSCPVSVENNLHYEFATHQLTKLAGIRQK